MSLSSQKEKEEETKRARQRKRAQEEPNVPGMNSPPTESTSLENATVPMAEAQTAEITEAEVAAPAPTPPADPQKDRTAFNKRIEQEYQHTMEQEIKKATQVIKRRYNAMLSQERTPMDVAVDALGHDTDYYENLVNAIQSGDKSVGATTEEVYQHLYDLTFTGMRSLSALKQQYSNL